VALVDVNLDGVLDLAVGAPSFSNTGALGYNASRLKRRMNN